MDILPNLTELDTASALVHFDNNTEAYLDILYAYFKNGEDIANQLHTLFVSKNWAGYTIKVHSLKGLSASIGAISLSEHAKQHEFAGKEGRTDFIILDYEALIFEYMTLLHKLEEFFASHSLPAADEMSNTDAVFSKPVSKEEFQKILCEIYELADCFEIDEAADKLTALKKHLLSEKQRIVVTKAIKLAENFDYEGIKELINDAVI